MGTVISSFTVMLSKPGKHSLEWIFSWHQLPA